MKKTMIGVAAVLVLVTIIGAMYAGILPMNLMGNLDTVTNQKHYGNFKGYGELIGPNDDEGFIRSWKEDGFSETITIAGRIEVEQQGFTIMTSMDKYSYTVYGFVDGDWIEISSPDKTTMYVTGTNPGRLDPPTAMIVDGVFNFDPYSFNLVGNDVEGIRAEFWCHIDWDVINPFNGYEWVKMQRDEAYMYSGYGGLYLPRGLDEDNPDLPYSTFEIGEVVRIGVETSKGGGSTSDLNWRVTLNEPYISADPDMDPSAGGGVVHEQFYKDDCSASNTFFTFTVTEEMAQKTMQTGLPYTVRIWNTILPMSTLNIDFIDFYYKAPGKAEITGPTTMECGSTASFDITAQVNSETQADIDFFRVSVVYGKSNTLLPSEWGDGRWIVHTTDVGNNNKAACTLPQVVAFTAEAEGYVTLFAKPFDVQGRPALTTQTYTLYFWKSVNNGGGGQPPDDVIDDEVGQDDYGGGHTRPWLPWEPSDSPWYNTALNEVLVYIIMALIIIMFAVIAIAAPLPGAPISRVLVFILGVVIAILLYFFPPW